MFAFYHTNRLQYFAESVAPIAERLNVEGEFLQKQRLLMAANGSVLQLGLNDLTRPMAILAKA